MNIETRNKLIADHAEILAKRSDTLAQANDIAARAETSPEDLATLESLVQEIRNLDSRLTAIETQLADDTAEDTAEVADETASRSMPEVSVRNLPAPPVVVRQAPKRIQSGPAFVSDLNDRRSNRNRDLAFRGWALAQTGQTRPEFVRAAREIGFDLNQRSLSFRLFEKAPKSADFTRAGTPLGGTPAYDQTGEKGGYTVPYDMVRELEKALLYTCPIRDYAKVIRTTAGNPMEIPTMNDTASKGEIIGENSAHNEDTLVFGQKLLAAHKYSSKIVRVSMELLQDSAVNIAEVVGSALGERIGRIQLDHFTTGSGSTLPEGVVTGAGNGGTSAASGAIGVDDLLALIASVDLAYRQNASFMMSDATLIALRKLRYATSGEPIFNVDYRQDGAPTRLFSYPVIVNNSMAAVGASAKAVLFGDFSQFWIRDSMEIQVMQSMERYFEYSQTGFLAVARADSAVINSAAIKVLTVKA
jgi:HK97 family phage major capsid protein